MLFDGNRAVGVEVDDTGSRAPTIRARREVVLAAGAINSPKLLLQSGHRRCRSAQRARHRRRRIDRPGVGANLQDHLELYIQYAARQPITLYRYWNAPMKALIGLWWLLAKRGPGATNHFEACAFIRSAAGISYPDIQYHFLPLAVRYDGRAAAVGHGFQAHVGPMRARSRGQRHPRLGRSRRSTSRFASTIWPTPTTSPISAAVSGSPARSSRSRPSATMSRPSFSRVRTSQSDAEIDDFIRGHAESAYHPCGTCRMGSSDDPLAVVDAECRVIGVDGLRVADSSVFPQITNGNLNAPSIMVGEKASDCLLGKAPLPADTATPWQHPEWQTIQR